MIFLTLVVFGWKSYQQLPLNLMPDISYPTLTVRTEYEGAAPEDVEKLLTRPLEETLSIVSGMVEINSVSSPSLSEIVLEFTWDTDMNVAQQEVRDRLDLFEPPQEVTKKPIILRYDPTLDPIMRVALTGRSHDDIADPDLRAKRIASELTELRDAAERYIKAELEGKKGIAQVLVKGGREEEIQILVESDLAKRKGISLGSIVQALAQQNINLSGGTLREGQTEFLVRTLNEYQDVDEIPDSIIGNADGKPVRLSEVAQVFLGEKERDTIVRINEKEAVELQIFKEGDANTVSVCERIRTILGFEEKDDRFKELNEALQRARESSNDGRGPQINLQADPDEVLAKIVRGYLPAYAELTLINDQSRFIESAIDEVQQTAVVGGILALLVLYFFLREFKSTTIIGVAIPISVVATFIPMYFREVSLNIMSLGGLALGIGMLVDNSIVVLESIFRCGEEGDDTTDAAERGTNEVSSAVVASTLTTIAVFLPIAFVEGVAGQLFRDQALTVTFSLIASLLAALFLIPMIASRKKVNFSASAEVIWILRAYKENRASGKSVVTAFLGITPRGFTYALASIRETAADYFGPPIQGIQGKGEGNHALGALGGLILLPLSAMVFALHLLMQAFVHLYLMPGFVLFSILAVVAVRVIGKALYIGLWLPAKVFDVVFAVVRRGYVAILERSLALSPIALTAVILVACHAFYSVGSLGRELIPPMKQGEFGIRMEAPPGTRLEETESRARAIERLALDYDQIETCAVEIGQDESEAGARRGENVAEFTILLKDPDRNARFQDDIMEGLRRAISEKTSEKEVTFTLPSLFSFKTAVELQIRGDELDELKRVGQAVLRELNDVQGLRDAELNIRAGYPEIIVKMDKDLLSQYGLSAEQVAQRLRTEIQGDAPTRFNRDGNKIDIRIRTDQRRLQSVEDLAGISILEGATAVRLDAVAELVEQEGPSEIRRVAQRHVALITANIEGRDLGAVTQDVIERAARVNMPADFLLVPGGQFRELQTSESSLKFALLLAMFLVYVVMASQFESMWHPAIIMFSLPLAFIGVIYTLHIFGISLSVVVFIGGIILAGIVVNNAIVLIDYINQLRRRGVEKRKAVIEAGRVRLRPILMTTTTTVLGLLPMALGTGDGAEMRRPMALTVMSGLIASTVLTLVIIPMIYDLVTGKDKA
jgi:HAE1 family hydrophobic/amphiphilic exporter-1